MAECLILLADDVDLWGPGLKPLVATVLGFGWAVLPDRNQPGSLGVRSLCLNIAYAENMKSAQGLVSDPNSESS